MSLTVSLHDATHACFQMFMVVHGHPYAMACPGLGCHWRMKFDTNCTPEYLFHVDRICGEAGFPTLWHRLGKEPLNR